jgi:Ca2+-binding EF-hand superfamily protein
VAGGVPPLAVGSAKKPSNKQVTNDEVAAMLQALQLDKGFFDSLMRRDKMMKEKAEEEEEAPTIGQSITEEFKKVQARRESDAGNHQPRVDFDVYLNEALMPVLAQSLDSLCRQVAKMEQQGDNLDPKVRERFNPLTFLAQQLLRRHPKCARTPRRQALYEGFSNWANQERGRREMIRRQSAIKVIFSGFVLRGVVQTEDIPNVLTAIDDAMKLEGCLMKHKAMSKDFGIRSILLQSSGEPGGRRRSQAPRSRASFFAADTGCTWQRFWATFSGILLSNEVVPYSAIRRGEELKKEELVERAQRVEAQEKLREARIQKEAEHQQKVGMYEEIYGRLCECVHLNAILQDNKILTGDEVRPTDAGYEFEVPPHGVHVKRLQELLGVLGLIEESSISEEDDCWWTSELAAAWSVLQDVFRAELTDGVVEREVLEKVLVPPASFMALKSRVEDELERRAEAKGEMSQFQSDDVVRTFTHDTKAKPTYEQLAEMTGMTVPRVEWLHTLFETYMDPDPARPDELQEDMYPESPSKISKAKMKELITDVNPDVTDPEFEARFLRIDQDGSGEIEFDEFVKWISADDVRVMGNDSKKMTFQELANAHRESLEVITYLHNCYQDALPEGLADRYPDDPVPLAEAEMLSLIKILTPNVDEEEAKQHIQAVDYDNKGQLDFDEFLEVLRMDELPAELRQQFSPTEE